MQSENWTEIRCPACIDLGHVKPRFLFCYIGMIPETEARLAIKCRLCHSWIEWTIGTPLLKITKKGTRVRKTYNETVTS